MEGVLGFEVAGGEASALNEGDSDAEAGLDIAAVEVLEEGEYEG